MLSKLLSLVGTEAVKFAVFVYRAKETGEVARVSVMLGASLTSLYQQDVAVLKSMIPTLDGISKEAAEAILKSREESLNVGIGNNSAYVHAPQNADTYAVIPGLNGVKVHKETGELYVSGLVSHKTVLEAGTYKEVKSRPLTIAKREISKTLGSSKYRQYILRNIEAVTIDGDTLTITTN